MVHFEQYHNQRYGTASNLVSIILVPGISLGTSAHTCDRPFSEIPGVTASVVFIIYRCIATKAGSRTKEDKSGCGEIKTSFNCVEQPRCLLVPRASCTELGDF